MISKGPTLGNAEIQKILFEVLGISAETQQTMTWYSVYTHQMEQLISKVYNL